MENLEITQAVLELALARQEAGAGNEVDVNAARSEVLQAELDTRNTELDAYEARRGLVTLLFADVAAVGIEIIRGSADERS